MPAAAVQVTGVSVGLTPRRRLIEPKGMPDSVCSAGSSRWPRSSARVSSPPLGSYLVSQQGE